MIFFRKLFLFSLSLFSCAVYGQDSQNKTKGNENTLLWSISGNGLKETSYLFGTIHVICGSDFIVRDKVSKAFQSSSQLYLELDLDDPAEMKKMHSSVYGDVKLSELLTEEEQFKLNTKLVAELGIQLEQVDSYSLGTVYMLFLMNGLSCESTRGYEQYLLEEAKKSNMEIRGLETVDFQASVLSEATSNEESYEAIFNDTLSQYLDSLMVYYKNEDLESLNYLFFDSGYMSNKELDNVLVLRNKNWVEIMPKIMKKKATFFGVGAGHLIGNSGVIALLREEGYIVEPIF